MREPSYSDSVSYYQGELRVQVMLSNHNSHFENLFKNWFFHNFYILLRWDFQSHQSHIATLDTKTPYCLQVYSLFCPVSNLTKRWISAQLHSVFRHRRWEIVSKVSVLCLTSHSAASDQGQRDGVSGRRGLLPGVQRHRERDKCEGHASQH